MSYFGGSHYLNDMDRRSGGCGCLGGDEGVVAKILGGGLSSDFMGEPQGGPNYVMARRVVSGLIIALVVVLVMLVFTSQSAALTISMSALLLLALVADVALSFDGVKNMLDNPASQAVGEQ